MEKKSKKANEIALVKLVVRLCICMVAIGVMFLCESVSGCFVLKAQSTNSGDSFSTEQQTVNLLLNKRKDTDNVAFKVSNMFPGDAVTGNYCIKVSYDEAATLNFRVDIAEGYEKLAEVLKCKIVLAATGEVLHDGLMKEVPDAVEVTLTDIPNGEDELSYEITAYLDTSVGNEYQNKGLEADFVWWLEVAEQRIEITSLTILPEGLKNTEFNTIEKIKSELSRVLISAGGSEYDIDNMEFYDVRLQFWNGREWIDATGDNFPLEGITVTLPYPDGTDRNAHDFIVSHMFTVDSERLGIKAGDVEYPPVTKTADGLQVTFKGLSPVAIAWKELKTEEKVPDTSTEGDTFIGNISVNDIDTGDSTNMTLWIVMTVCTAAALIVTIIVKKQKGGQKV